MVNSQQVEREKKLLAMGEMAASLAHEIRNPLGSMELYCSLLKKGLKELPEKFELADQIHQGIKRLDRIISNCLQFSRDVKPRAVLIEDWESYLSAIKRETTDRAERAGVIVQIEIADALPAYLDKYLIHQALLNILLNAIDAAEGSERSTVTITVSGTETECFISVEDSGSGITAAAREQIFDPFYTTKDGGTGLGLPIVQSIVSSHQGGLVVENGQAGGAIFTICLPRLIKEELSVV